MLSHEALVQSPRMDTAPPPSLPVGWDGGVLSYRAGNSVLLPHFPEPEREVAWEWELCLEARPGHLGACGGYLRGRSQHLGLGSALSGFGQNSCPLSGHPPACVRF